MSNKEKSRNIAVLGLFTAVIIVLQMLSYTIKIGQFNLSFVLVPIILAAVLYGPVTGGFMGLVFGVVTYICSVAGLDAGGNVLFAASPLLTFLVCAVKGAAAGFVAGLIKKAFRGSHEYLSVVLAAAAAPIVNTGIFVLSMLLFFKSTLSAWAGGTDIAYYIIFSLIGVNFIIEFIINIVMAPAVYRVSKAVRRI
jgi:hypothetical protein